MNNILRGTTVLLCSCCWVPLSTASSVLFSPVWHPNDFLMPLNTHSLWPHQKNRSCITGIKYLYIWILNAHWSMMAAMGRYPANNALKQQSCIYWRLTTRSVRQLVKSFHGNLMPLWTCTVVLKSKMLRETFFWFSALQLKTMKSSANKRLEIVYCDLVLDDGKLKCQLISDWNEWDCRLCKKNRFLVGLIKKTNMLMVSECLCVDASS